MDAGFSWEAKVRTSFTPRYKVMLWCLLLNSNCHVGSLGWRGQVGPPATRLAVSGSAGCLGSALP